MGIMMAETCWVNLKVNKRLYLCHPLVHSSPTLMMHGHMNLKFVYWKLRCLVKQVWSDMMVYDSYYEVGFWDCGRSSFEWVSERERESACVYVSVWRGEIWGSHSGECDATFGKQVLGDLVAFILRININFGICLLSYMSLHSRRQ